MSTIRELSRSMQYLNQAATIATYNLTLYYSVLHDDLVVAPSIELVTRLGKIQYG